MTDPRPEITATPHPIAAEVLGSVDQLSRAEIEEPVAHEVLLPVNRYQNQVIRLGKAIVAVPEKS